MKEEIMERRILNAIMIIGGIIILGWLFSGCASAPVVTETIKPPAFELPEGCTQSTISKPGDAYSYQGDIDPQTITQDWIVLPDETRPYGPNAIEVYYKNPNMPCEIPIAVFLVHKGAFDIFAYLQNGEAHLYALDSESKCYRGGILKGFARYSFRRRLLIALGAKPI